MSGRPTACVYSGQPTACNNLCLNLFYVCVFVLKTSDSQNVVTRAATANGRRAPSLAVENGG